MSLHYTGSTVERLAGTLTPTRFLLSTSGQKLHKDHSCSIIIPARNEAGTIRQLVQLVPEMGLGTEVIAVEGGSRDGTWAVLRELASEPGTRSLTVLKQRGQGKAGAVREGIAAAAGELIFILDADATVDPGELPLFYEAICGGQGRFGNGTRMIYPMEPDAMPLLNRWVNRAFAAGFSGWLGQRITDALCGTKVFFKTDYEEMARARSIGAARAAADDPFGDFELLFGAGRLGLKIVEVPVRYRRRRYGRTNIRRWRDGWQLLRIWGRHVASERSRAVFLPERTEETTPCRDATAKKVFT